MELKQKIFEGPINPSKDKLSVLQELQKWAKDSPLIRIINIETYHWMSGYKKYTVWYWE